MTKAWIGLWIGLIPTGESGAVELYKYIDSEGRVHFTDRPPVDEQVEKLDLKIKSYEGPAKVIDYAAILKPDPRVRMYSAEWCGVCKRAKKYMRAKRIAFTEYDIDKSQRARRKFDKLKGKGVPIFIVGNKRMNGFSPDRLQAIIKKAKETR